MLVTIAGTSWTMSGVSHLVGLPLYHRHEIKAWSLQIISYFDEWKAKTRQNQQLARSLSSAFDLAVC